MNSEARKRAAKPPPTSAREELRALAAEATSGTWGIASTDGMGFAVHRGEHETVALYLDRPNARYIAAASPDRITALLDDLDAAERERDEARAKWREVCEDLFGQCKLTDSYSTRAERAEAQAAAVREIHRPIRVYDECEHDADHGCEPIEVYDYTGCSESVIGWGCAVCCYVDEYPREDCPHGADHSGVAEAASCPTRAALDIPADTSTEPDADGPPNVLLTEDEADADERPALARHRHEWADYFEHWTQAVGPEPLTVELVIKALRGDTVPFGVAEGGEDRG